MRKRIFDLFLILIWSAVIIVTVLCISRKTDTMYQSRKDTEIVQVNEYLYMEQGCSDSEVEQIQALLGYLPQSLFEDFRNENGKVFLVSDLKDNCIGSTEINNEGITVYIKNEYVLDALIHEFGHVYLHFHSLDDGFKEIYETEAKSLVNAYYGDSPYYYSDEVEYFAQAFQTVVCMWGYDTQEAAPQTFSYINNLITDMLNEK